MRAKTVIFIAACFVMAACTNLQTTNPGVVGIDRAQDMRFPSEQYNQSMAKTYASMLDDAADKHGVNQDGAMVSRVDAIMQRMIPGTAVFRSDAPGWKWEVNIIHARNLNAFCIGEGKLGFFSGIIQRLRLTDDEIAAIMGHEIAHALREHGRERASQRLKSQFGAGLIGAVVGATNDEVSDLTNLFYLLPNSREQEAEADRIGVELAARAGYDPAAAVTMWRKIMFLAGDQTPQFLNSHPTRASRLTDLQTYAEKVIDLYKPMPGKEASQGSTGYTGL